MKKSVGPRIGQKDLTVGSIPKTLLTFAIPFFIASTLQSLYGAVDLFVIGHYAGTSSVSAVANGAQLMQLITSVIIGTTTGITVSLGRHIGEKDEESCSNSVGSAIIIFAVLAAVLTPLLLIASKGLIKLVNTPPEAADEAVKYMLICACGIPFIAAYNVGCGIFRGIGNSKLPMYFVAVSCGVNIVGDILLVGVFRMGAPGAALATVIAQAISAAAIVTYILIKKLPFPVKRQHIRPRKRFVGEIVRVGVPISFQDVLIGCAFTAITIIANTRGLISSSAVGVTEKTIMFMFLVPSAMTSAVSAITAQNMGAGKYKRAYDTLKFGITFTVCFGIVVCILTQLFTVQIASIFTKDEAVVIAAAQYLRSYVLDVVLVAITFCLNGYLTGTDRAGFVFLHNTLSIFLCRIPVAYFMSRLYPDSLLPMGFASPAGSLCSILIMVIYFIVKRKETREKGLYL